MAKLNEKAIKFAMDRFGLTKTEAINKVNEVKKFKAENQKNKLEIISKQGEKEILYARQCDITGEGMNEGWCWGDGLFYSKYEADTIKELRKDLLNSSIVNEDGKLKAESWSDDAILKMGYDSDVLYWTEWEEEDLQYKEVNGELIEIED